MALCRKRQNHLENIDNIATLLPHKQPRREFSRNYYIKLAAESPKHSEVEESEYASDSEYDGILHGQETDICKDSSDTDDTIDSYESDKFATLDVLEYEIATSSSEPELSHDSSSGGTDEFAFAAAATATAILDCYKTSSFENTDFEIFADSEDFSDDSIDPELGLADYWTCVKCKNRKNSPLYRFCEKCYKLRKELFPPRPKKLRKRRSKKMKHLSSGESNKINCKEYKQSSAAPSSSSSSSLYTVSNISEATGLETKENGPIPSTSSIAMQSSRKENIMKNLNIIKLNNQNSDNFLQNKNKRKRRAAGCSMELKEYGKIARYGATTTTTDDSDSSQNENYNGKEIVNNFDIYL